MHMVWARKKNPNYIREFFTWMILIHLYIQVASPGFVLVYKLIMNDYFYHAYL